MTSFIKFDVAGVPLPVNVSLINTVRSGTVASAATTPTTTTTIFGSGAVADMAITLTHTASTLVVKAISDALTANPGGAGTIVKLPQGIKVTAFVIV